MNKRINAFAKTLFYSGLFLVAFSCSEDLEDAQLEMNQTVSKTEVTTILETDEFSSAADDLITEIFEQGETLKSAKDEDCYVTEFSDSGFTVDFDQCTLVDSDKKLNGLLTIDYKEGEESTSFTATYSNLGVGDYTVNGTRSFTMSGNGDSENISFTIVSNMSVVLADGSVIEEAGTKTYEIIIDFEDFAKSATTIDGNWTVKADGNTYVVAVTSVLEANFTCDHVGKGIMTLAKNGLEVTVDFGDGTCDDIASLTYPDGTIEEISLKE